MSTNVGAVDFELFLNSNPFNKGLKNASNNIKSSGIESMLGKIGKAALAAFSVKAVVDFTKSCLELGSNLAEVQNVVDVTFGNLNEEVDKFAQNAITQFGLGQTVTKKYVGTFGAMAKAFDFNNQAALEMSKTLTGLTGDVASFYNLSTDEAFTKLKSVFTGETETLKDLGVVMTQNALDQYALTNGYGKTTAKMSEQEKTALRYQFVLDKLSLAQGDFARTSDSWANQTRVLSLRFNELKASLGQGFINLFTPIVQGINWVLSKLQVLADAFKSFTEFITGKKSDSSGGVGSIATDLSDVTNSADTASNAVSGIGTSAKKAAKDMKSLASFDTAQILQSNDEKSSGSGGAGGSAGGLDFGNSLSDTMQEANSEIDGFMKKARELVNLFKQGFSEGFGNFDFSSIVNSIEGIKNRLIDIFTTPEVLNAANNWINSVVLNLGRVVGSIASIGATIADNLLGGINLFLEQNKQNLQDHLVRLFDISARDKEITGQLWMAIADIFTVFRGDTAKQITADIIAIFTEGILGVIEISGTLLNDLRYIILQPFIDNKDLIKETLQGILEPISSVLGTIKQGIQDTFATFWNVYDTYIAPAVENIKNGFSSILNTVLTVWNENIKPILDEWASGFDTLWKEHLQPMVNSFLEFIGKLINGLLELWNTWLVPIINWIVENVVPVIAPILDSVWNTISSVFASIIDVLKGLWDALGGLIDFIVGVFTGDWGKAWQGICDFFTGLWNSVKGIFKGIWEAIKGIVDTVINTIKGTIQSVLNAISSIWGNIWNGIKNIVSNVWNGITSTIINVINGIKNTISNILNTISSIWYNIWNGMKNTVTNIFNGIWNAIRGVINSILGGIEGMANGVVNGINWVIRALNNLSFDIPDWVPGIGGSKFGFNIPQLSRVSLPRLAEGGYVKANTPQLAMIGDNRHQGEIVAPEDKILSLYKQANKEMGIGNNDSVIELLKTIIELLRNIDFNPELVLDGYRLNKVLEKIKNKKKFATNGG
nr:MAG TPA: minor tail protein [Caudoviricetes sp.]